MNHKLLKLKIQADNCKGKPILDISFSANPNPFLKGAVSNKDIVPMLQKSDLFIYTIHTYSLDKAIL